MTSMCVKQDLTGFLSQKNKRIRITIANEASSTVYLVNLVTVTFIVELPLRLQIGESTWLGSDKPGL